MSTWNDYVNRLTVNGTTQRERTLNEYKRDLTSYAKGNLSYKSVLINNEERQIMIDAGTKPYLKIIKSLPDETFSCGQYVNFGDCDWLIINADWDNEVYTDGNMQQCNYNLRWQNSNCEIIERQCCVMSASQYNSGESATKTITVGYNQLLVYLPLDDETLMFKSDERFFIDNELALPKVYKLTRIDSVSMSYQGIGCVILLFTESQYNPKTDRIDLMLCDYKEQPEPANTGLDIAYNGQPQVVCGGNGKTFTAVSEYPIVLWEKKCTTDVDEYISIIPDALHYGKCKVKCANNSLCIGGSFKIKCTDDRGNTGELLVNIVGGV